MNKIRGIRGYTAAFSGERQHDVAYVRALRRLAWDDARLEPVEKVILGLTGCTKQLTKYQQMALAVMTFIGQPLVVVERLEANGQVARARGGRITGGLYIESSSSCMGISGHRGHAVFNVPVEPLITHYGGNVVEVQPVSGLLGDETSVTVSHLINNEAGNTTQDPSRDYYETMPLPFLMGRQAVCQSLYFGQGLREVLRIADTLM